MGSRDSRLSPNWRTTILHEIPVSTRSSAESGACLRFWPGAPAASSAATRPWRSNCCRCAGSQHRGGLYRQGRRAEGPHRRSAKKVDLASGLRAGRPEGQARRRKVPVAVARKSGPSRGVEAHPGQEGARRGARVVRGFRGPLWKAAVREYQPLGRVQSTTRRSAPTGSARESPHLQWPAQTRYRRRVFNGQVLQRS